MQIIKDIYKLVVNDIYLIYRSIFMLFGLTLFSAYIELEYHVNILYFRELLPEWITLILEYILKILYWVLPFVLRSCVSLYVISYVISFIGTVVRTGDIDCFFKSLSIQVFDVASRLFVIVIVLGGELYHILNAGLNSLYNVKDFVSLSWYEYFMYTFSLWDFTFLNIKWDHAIIYLINIVFFVMIFIRFLLVNSTKRY